LEALSPRIREIRTVHHVETRPSLPPHQLPCGIWSLRQTVLGVVMQKMGSSRPVFSSSLKIVEIDMDRSATYDFL